MKALLDVNDHDLSTIVFLLIVWVCRASYTWFSWCLSIGLRSPDPVQSSQWLLVRSNSTAHSGADIYLDLDQYLISLQVSLTTNKTCYHSKLIIYNIYTLNTIPKSPPYLPSDSKFHPPPQIQYLTYPNLNNIRNDSVGRGVYAPVKISQHRTQRLRGC